MSIAVGVEFLGGNEMCGRNWTVTLTLLTVISPTLPAASPHVIDDRSDLLRIVDERFRRWDRNRDRRLSVREVDDVVADRSVLDDEAAAIAAVKRTLRMDNSNITLTQKQLEQLIRQRAANPTDDLARMYAEGLRQIRSGSRRLFSSRRPQLDTIQQGRLGNCFVLAPLGAVLHASPDRVTRMFIEQANGRYGVRLGGRVVQVDSPTDAERAQAAANEGDGVWVNVFEKAIGAALRIRGLAGTASTSIDAIAGGGSSAATLELITGYRPQRYVLGYSADPQISSRQVERYDAGLSKLLEETLRNQRAAIATTASSNTPGLPHNHAYAVLEWNGRRQIIRLWNPHGGEHRPLGLAGPKFGYPTKDGIFEMPLSDFRDLFNGIAAETNRPYRTSPPLPLLP